MQMHGESMEERVWQRIAGQSVPEREDLRQLMYLAMEQVSAMGHLAEAMTGRPQHTAKQLYAESRRSLNMLRGIQRMSGGFLPQMRDLPVSRVQPAKLTEQCFHRSGRLLTEYASRVMDPEFGTVWQVLADRERASAAQLAELAGMTESRK